jgi:hypothetical protein
VFTSILKLHLNRALWVEGFSLNGDKRWSRINPAGWSLSLRFSLEELAYKLAHPSSTSEGRFDVR